MVFALLKKNLFLRVTMSSYGIFSLLFVLQNKKKV